MRIDKAFRIVDFIIRLAEMQEFSLSVFQNGEKPYDWCVVTSKPLSKAGKLLLKMKGCKVEDILNNGSVVY